MWCFLLRVLFSVFLSNSFLCVFLFFVSVTIVWNVMVFDYLLFRVMKLLMTSCQFLEDTSLAAGLPASSGGARGEYYVRFHVIPHFQCDVLNLFSCFQLNLVTLFHWSLGSLIPEPFCSSSVCGCLLLDPLCSWQKFQLFLVCSVSWTFLSCFKMSSLPFS